MRPKVRFIWLLILGLASSDAQEAFTFNGFRGAELSMDGVAEITDGGLLRLTNTTKLVASHAFYPSRIRFRASPMSGVFSFSSNFVFGIVSEDRELSGHGVAFVVSPSTDFRGAIGAHYMGLFNATSNGNPSNHILAVELDTILNPEFRDIDFNHAGIDINSLISLTSFPAGYFAGDGAFRNLSLISGDPIQVWVDYDGIGLRLNVTLSPMGLPKPQIPLLSSTVDLSGVLGEMMYVGFSSSSDPFLTSHYLLGWSFGVNGTAPALDLSRLPPLPRRETEERGKALRIWLPIAMTLLVLSAAAAAALVVRRRARFAELHEEWELERGPSRISYKDLFEATGGFSEKQLLGAGGFGAVYRGFLPGLKKEVAVKKVSHGSRQGMREFVAEIASVGRIRHRNLVQLQGYCRRKGKLLLAYDFMPNGSLDKLLFGQEGGQLRWAHRFRIIKGVASALRYLHEEWEQVIIHRDVKSGNVLLDGDMEPKLGDFGLARLYDHGTDPQTTRVVGTLGYLAPEVIKIRRASKATDVFAFGVFLLEVACGRRPIELDRPEEEIVLADFVAQKWRSGRILEVADRRMGDCAMEEVDLVLRLGLLCSDPLPLVRPNMQRVVQFLEGGAPLPSHESTYMNPNIQALLQNEVYDDHSRPFPSITDVLLSGGR